MENLYRKLKTGNEKSVVSEAKDNKFLVYWVQKS